MVKAAPETRAALRPVLPLRSRLREAIGSDELLTEIAGLFAEEWPRLLAVGAGSVLVLAAGYVVFDRLRDTLAEEV